MGSKVDSGQTANQEKGTIVHVDAAAPATLRLPVPADDPNDPLNFSTAEKLATYLTICLFTFIANVNASNFTVAIAPLSKEFKTSTTKAGYLVCFNVLLFGVGNIFWVPAMRVVGKRPVYISALALLSLCNVWSFYAHTWGSLLGSRIVSGFAAAAADATVPSLVADMFFIKERGKYMMLFHLSLSSGLFIGPLINAFIVREHGWRWSCGFQAIFAGFVFCLAVFMVKETTYLEDRTAVKAPRPVKKSYWQSLSVTGGYNRHASFLGVFIDIVCLVVYPPVLWGGFVIGVFVGWNIVVQLTSSQTFIKPPYGWQVSSLGLLSISGFIGAILAFYVGGPLIDRIAIRAAARQHDNKLHPESRLTALIIPALIGPMGILIFGLCVAHKVSWGGAAVGYGMQGFGLTALSNVVVTFCVDCYQPVAGEALVTIFVVRNTIGAMLSLFSADWIKAGGTANAFGEMVGIQYALLLVGLPMYLFAGRILKMTGNWRPMARFERL